VQNYGIGVCLLLSYDNTATSPHVESIPGPPLPIDARNNVYSQGFVLLKIGMPLPALRLLSVPKRYTGHVHYTYLSPDLSLLECPTAIFDGHKSFMTTAFEFLSVAYSII